MKRLRYLTQISRQLEDRLILTPLVVEGIDQIVYRGVKVKLFGDELRISIDFKMIPNIVEKNES